jgi:hypothetical protein
MKSRISTIALSTVVAIASLTQAHAQTHKARVNVPFAFEYAGHHFSAGTYIIGMQSREVAVLTNAARQNLNLALIESISTEGSADVPGSMTFRKYGNTYFLTEYSSRSTDVTLIESKLERNVAREYAANRTPFGLVQIPALGE